MKVRFYDPGQPSLHERGNAPGLPGIEPKSAIMSFFANLIRI